MEPQDATTAELTYCLKRLTKMIVDLDNRHKSLEKMLMRHIYDNHPEEDHCHCIWECECN